MIARAGQLSGPSFDFAFGHQAMGILAADPDGDGGAGGPTAAAAQWGGDDFGAADSSATIVASAADEPTRAIAPGGSLSGVIGSAGDADDFTISLVAGKSYSISLQGSGTSPLDDAFLSLSSGATVVASDDDGGVGANAFLTFTVTASGTYTIAAEGSSGATGGYTLDVRQMAADSVGATIASAKPIAVGATEFGAIETSGDIDMFAVTLVAGEYYSFEVAGGADDQTDPLAVAAGEVDTYMEVYDSAGNLLDYNDDISYPDDVSSAITFRAAASDTYYIKVDAYPQETGGFALDVRPTDLATLDPLDTIDWGSQLASTDVTVYFAKAGQTFDGVTSLGWSQYEIDRTMAALQTWAAVANVHFSIATSATGATFKLVTTETDEYLGFFHPPGDDHAGVGAFAVNGYGWDSTGGLEAGGYGFNTLVHEFGHGLGLAHPHDGGGTSTIMPGVTGPDDSYGAYDLNQGVYTVMSYNDGWPLQPDADTTTLPVTYGYLGGPSALDIAVVQEKYGTVARNSGNTVYVLPNSNAPGTYWQTIWDTAGIDTIQQSGAIGARIDLTAATLDYSATGGGVISYADGIFGGFTIAAGVVIENATGGSGDDVLIGNQAANVLNGGAGADVMQARGGNDIYVVDNSGDVVTEAAGEGTDRVDAAISYTLGANVENLTLTGSAALSGTGNALANVITGNGAANVLTGGAGSDTLNGAAGGDTLAGGAGNDIYVVDNSGDAVTEAAGEGTDQVNAAISYTLGANVENLTLTGSVALAGTGNTLANVITGNGVANLLTGAAGNDTLNGGAGADTLKGGSGNDIYIVDSASDTIIEGSGAGTDTEQASVTDTLAANVENLTLTGGAAINGTGNGLANILIGNAAANVLSGLAGADSMRGGAGADTYIVDNAGDTVVEASNQGNDNVQASVSFALSTNVENLTLSGTSAIDATGNGLTNALTGNSGGNLLSGLDGADTIGGLGGADTLSGGKGNDILTGGAGADTFLFNTALSAASNVDQLLDFRPVDDTIALDQSVFAALPLGTLAAGAFVTGTTAADASDRIIYDSASGKIYYDADGNGGGAKVLFAQITAGLALSNADFNVVSTTSGAASRDVAGASDFGSLSLPPHEAAAGLDPVALLHPFQPILSLDYILA
jgi:serralysin